MASRKRRATLYFEKGFPARALIVLSSHRKALTTLFGFLKAKIYACSR
jgi:hypothetical protein